MLSYFFFLQLQIRIEDIAKAKRKLAYGRDGGKWKAKRQEAMTKVMN